MAHLDKDTGNTLFGGLLKSRSLEVPVTEVSAGLAPATANISEKTLPANSGGSKVQQSRTPEVKSATKHLPKWKTLEKVTVLISAKQKGVIDDLAKLIMRARAHDDTPTEGRERITANTVLRVLIDLLDEKTPADPEEAINNEDELREWMRRIFR